MNKLIFSTLFFLIISLKLFAYNSEPLDSKEPTITAETTDECIDLEEGIEVFSGIANMPLALDTDGDGIDDVDDLDDDNDGIVDTDECIGFGPELVVNGDFEDAWAYWTSDFNRGSNNNGPTSGGCGSQGWVAVSNCATKNGICDPYFDYNGGTFSGGDLITDTYGVGANTVATTNCNQTVNSCFNQVLADHTTGTGFSVYVDPSDIVGKAYWKHTVAVSPGKNYQFSAWIMVIEEDPNLQFRIDGAALTTGINLDRQTAGTDGTDEWQNVAEVWNSGTTSGTVVIELVNLTTGCGGNDIRIDDISLKEVLIICDSDNDGIDDRVDLDSDNDGIPDIIEAGGVDTDGDGRVDYPIAGDPTSMVDLDGDGLADTYDETDTAGGTPGWTAGTAILNPDTDGDKIPDAYDLDADNDGIPDLIEVGGTDIDGNGLADNTTDSDGDGYYDVYDPSNEVNAGVNEGTPLLTTGADSGNGTPSTPCANCDTDGDGFSDHLDLDADNDGIPDLIEAGGTDINGDGSVDYIKDSDADGYMDIFDPENNENAGLDEGTAHFVTGADNGNGRPTTPCADCDADGDTFPDYLDLDADNDGIPDLIEIGGTDINGDGRVDVVTDSDNDGYADTYDPVNQDNVGVNIGTAHVVTGADSGDGTPVTMCADCDSDGDGFVDHLDLDADNDGIPDLIEVGGTDINGDGRVDVVTDSDNDGYADTFDPTNEDNAGVNEGTAHILTGADSGDGTPNSMCADCDTDGDGFADHLDLDADNDGIPDLIEVGGTDINGDGRVDVVTDSDDDGYADTFDPTNEDNAGVNEGTAHFVTSADSGNGTPSTMCVLCDRDEDGFSNHLDLDADNDGIPDIVEAGGTDTDGDGRVDTSTDLDNDGYQDIYDGNLEGCITTTSSANHTGTYVAGSSSGVINGANVNGGADGNFAELYTNGNEIVIDFGTSLTNTDSYVITWRRKPSYNNVGTSTITVEESNDDVTYAANGTISYAATVGGQATFETVTITPAADTRYVRLANTGAGGQDFDVDAIIGTLTTTTLDCSPPDGTPHFVTGADSGNGKPTIACTDCDQDVDGFPNYLDLDSDNDGIVDVIEAGGTDADGNGMEDGFVDTDTDGFNDGVDGDVGNDGTAENSGSALLLTGADTDSDGVPNSYPNANTDTNGNPDFLDIDSDDDGIVDNTEAQPTDNYVAPTTDSDNDGINDAYEVVGTIGTFGGAGITPENTEGTGLPDYQDTDSDDDTILDVIEGHDTNGDNVVDGTDAPAANTGLAGGTTDIDNDGLLDGFDNNTASTDATNAGLNPESHPDVKQGTSEQDWREAIQVEANDDELVGQVVGTVPVNILTNDLAEDGLMPTAAEVSVVLDETSVTGGTLNGNGSVTVADEGTWTYTAGTGILEFVPLVTFTKNPQDLTYILTETATGLSDVATVNIEYIDGNLTDANNDFVNTPFNTKVKSSVLTNDKDVENHTQSVTTLKVDSNGDGLPNMTQTIASATTVGGVNKDGSPNTNAGSLTQNANGSYEFTPTTNFVGTVTYEYTICDNGSPVVCDEAIVTLKILGESNTATTNVTANSDAVTTEAVTSITSNLTANDNDPEGTSINISDAEIDTDGDGLPDATLTLGTGTQVAGVDEDNNPIANAGTLTINAAGTFTFVPAAGFTGTVTAAYEITDADGDVDVAPLVIEVLPNIGNEIFATDDSALTDEQTPVSGNLTTNDTDPESNLFAVTVLKVDTDGDGLADTDKSADIELNPITVAGTDGNGNPVANAGTLNINYDGTYTFTPSAGFAGNVNIEYTICDAISPSACDVATLEISVLPVFRDYGDAPAIYPAAWHRAMVDGNSDNVLDGTNDVWLGTNTIFETSGSEAADTDDDAMAYGSTAGQFPTSIAPSTSYSVDIDVNSTTANTVYYGMWIDWNNDGNYDDFYNGSQATTGGATTETATVNITSPSSFANDEVNVRLRVDDSPLVSTDFAGGKTNGEVEDFKASVALPVELISFKAKEKDCEVKLSWATASEEKFDYFELQWSGDGHDFQKVKNILGEGGNYYQAYNFTDKRVAEINYYRLKMIDLDGSSEYSKIVTVTTNCGAVNDLNIYPNPVAAYHGVLNVEFFAGKSTAQLSITDMLGRTVRRLNIEAEEGVLNSVQIDISDLPAGTYTLQHLGNRTPQHFIIQE